MKTALIVLICAAALPALAQNPTEPPAEPPPRTVIFDEAEEVNGDRQTAGDITVGDVPERFRSLVKVRENFRPELLRSADDL